MRQVSPLPGSGAGIQIPYEKRGSHRHSSSPQDTANAEPDDKGESAPDEATAQSAPPGMGHFINKIV